MAYSASINGLVRRLNNLPDLLRCRRHVEMGMPYGDSESTTAFMVALTGYRAYLRRYRAGSWCSKSRVCRARRRRALIAGGGLVGNERLELKARALVRYRPTNEPAARTAARGFLPGRLSDTGPQSPRE
jgi:hypothetical protein